MPKQSAKDICLLPPLLGSVVIFNEIRLWVDMDMLHMYEYIYLFVKVIEIHKMAVCNEEPTFYLLSLFLSLSLLWTNNLSVD